MKTSKRFFLSVSILSANFANLEREIRAVEDAGGDWIHVDVMDGHFVPNITMGPFIVETVRKLTTLPLDCHLMIEKPERYIRDFIQAGADWISVHIEGNPNIHRTLQSIQASNVKAGIVLNPGTAVSAIEAVIPTIDFALVMSVNPGFSGQNFIPQTPGRIQSIREMCAKFNVQPLIEVDGGISADTLPACAEAGANCFVAATSVFKHPGGIAAGIQALRNAW